MTGEYSKKDLSWFPGLNYDPHPMTRSLVLRSAFAPLLLLGMGCASQSDNSGRQVRELTDQVRRLQSTTDRLEERLAAIENARQRDAQRPPPTVSLASELPNLPVVKVNPDSSVSANEARPIAGDGDEPRPLIVGEGSRIETRSSGNESTSVTPAPRRPKDKSATEPTTTKRPNGAMDSGKKSP